MIAELGSLWSGHTLCGPVRQWVIQSWVDAVLSSSLWSSPTLCGPVLQLLSDLVIVGLEETYPGDTPGDRRTCFADVRYYIVWSGLTVGAELG